MTREPLAAIGGRKFIVTMTAMFVIAIVALKGGDALAFGSIALCATVFVGGNSYVTGRALAKPEAS